ncbi:endothelin-converting enzyme 2 [Lasius niger]|uniref:Endothelin-converting enzyme 2 n=1 Tax=Lasius niger TaxID=67767 RepID=A0A0J7L5E9_LASNI|nr:endothelin-converting enzyme 2 [Lasius niger]
MPFRKTYQVNNREEGKTAQRDQSYRSCLIALLIFFFMCLILILACIPWKTRNHIEYKSRYMEDEPQHHHGERTKEAITTSIVMTVLSTIPTTPRTTTISATNTERTDRTEPTKDIDVITEDYSKKNIKGSRHFERYSENRTTEDETIIFPATVSEKEIEDFSTTKETVQYTETEEDIDLATLPHDIVTDSIIDNDAASTLSNGPIVSNATLKYNVIIVDVIENVASSKSVESTTDRYTPDIYYNTEKSKVDTAIDNITTSTLSSQLNDFEGYAAENFTSKYERFKAAIVTDITTPSLSTDSEESTSAKYFSDLHNYSEKSQFDITINNVITSTSPIQSDPEEARNMKYSNLNYKESTITEYSPTLIDENEVEDMTNATLKNYSETTQKYNENVTSSATEEYNAFSTNNYANVANFAFHNYTTSTISHDETRLTATLPDEDTNVCETGHCKQIASKMLSYMNHTADPCEDFYEYACGGFEADPQLMDGNLIQKSRNYQRITRQMLKEKRENVHSNFAKYYDSCVQYERDINFNERAKMANDALKSIGEFYPINGKWSDNYVNFTNLFAQLMLHHSALLFDVVPELDEYRPSSFTLKIGPTTYESPFKHMEDPCSENEIEMEGHYVDLEILYNNYKRCKSDTREFMRSIKETLTVLNVFKSLNDSYLELENIEKTIHVINTVLMQGYFSYFPSKSEIQEAYVMNNYSKVSLEELQSSSMFINWKQLIRSLTEMEMITSVANIQVYFHAALIKGLRRLEEFGKEDPIGLNNAIIGLYAHKLYHELVLPRRNNVKDHCLQVTTYLLQLEASSLYISSFADHEIAQMNNMTKKMFNELKQTLKLKTEKAQWAREEGRQGLLKKIDSLELALPVISYFKNRDLLYSEYNVNLSDNYFNNSIILLKTYRILMYAELRREVGDPKQIWTYYATPFQSKAQAIYGLNLVVIPYGIVDWSLINDELSFDYLLLATLGNLIAHQIAHHFDANGIHYWDQTRNTQDSLMYENEFTDTNFDDYINCQKESLYQGSMNMTLPFTDQTVSFMVNKYLTLQNI